MTQQRMVRVYDNGRPIWETNLDGVYEFCRVESPSRQDLPIIVRDQEAQLTRVYLARAQENFVSRRHIILRPVGDDSVEVSNVSLTNPIYTDRSEPIAKAADANTPTRRVFTLTQQPLLLTLRGETNNKAIRVELEETGLESLAVRSNRATQFMPAKQFLSIADLARRDDHESLQAWLHTLIDVLQSAANSNDFFQKAAQAVVDLVGMDNSSVLLYEQGTWRVAAQSGDTAANRPPSATILSRVLQDKQTMFRNAGSMPNQAASIEARASASLMMLDAVVAAPFFNERGEVQGLLYGERIKGTIHSGVPHISKVDATLVEALAHGVEVGLRRVDNEHKLIESQVRFEQFFSPELARELAANKDLLKGADRDVTALFCDIRNFSGMSEQLGAVATLELVSEFLDLVSEHVLAHGGVLVDFIGDELVAMWGAPQDQPNHAELACRAGLDMLAAIAAHDPQWIARIGKPLRAGVGINSGVARVGNIGSSRKFKYGPLGSSVNVASRVQGCNKYFRTEMLVTQHTRQRLGPEFKSRRIRKVRVVNIEAAFDLYEIWLTPQPEREQVARMYEEALEMLEKGEFRAASRKAAELVQRAEYEGPALVLASQALQFATNPDLIFSPEWTLPGK